LSDITLPVKTQSTSKSGYQNPTTPAPETPQPESTTSTAETVMPTEQVEVFVPPFKIPMEG
jgi:hypothetical protein